MASAMACASQALMLLYFTGHGASDADLLMAAESSRNTIVDLNAPSTSPVFELREKRRIKSNVIHYFDHPHFGMIATVTPYVSPEEAQQISATDHCRRKQGASRSSNTGHGPVTG
jgi:hypothetical protein